MKALRPALLATVLLAGACEVTRHSHPVGLDRAVVTRTEASRAWQVVEAGEVLGLVVMYSRPGEDGATVHYYSVRNEWHQELGTIDAQGRAFRHVPHEREARWVGTGTLLDGARAVLAGGDGAELVEVSIDELRRGRSGGD